MESKRIEGSFVALITPFNEDGSIDFEGFRTLLDFHESNGTSAVLIMAFLALLAREYIKQYGDNLAHVQ